MAESSLFWQTGVAGDGLSAYTQQQMMGWLHRTFGQGTIYGYSLGLAVSGTASPVSVAEGAAIVQGSPYENTAPVTFAVPTPTGGTTAYRVVLRWNDTLNTVRLALLASPDGISTPPVLTQTSTVYELLLADVVINTSGVITVTNRPVIAGQRTRTIFIPAIYGWNATTLAPLAPTLYGIQMTPTDEIIGFASFLCPPDFVSGMTIRGVVIADGTGNVQTSISTNYGANAEDYATHGETLSPAVQPVTVNYRHEMSPLSILSIQKGDYVYAAFTRHGPNGADTMGSDLFFIGALLTYTADN